MAEVLDFGAYSKTQAIQGAPLRTRNQGLLAQIDEALAARTPQEVLEAKIEGVKEELKANRMRHGDLVERRQGLVSELEKLREHGEMSADQTWNDEQRDAKIRELFDTARRAHAAQRSDEKAIFAEIVTALLAHEQADITGQPEEAWAAFRRECWSYSQEAIEQVLDGYKARAASVEEMERLTPAAALLKQQLLKQMAFDRVVADLPRLWREEGHGDNGKTWEELDAAEKTGYLAGHAAKHRVSFEQFVDGAASAVGLASSEAFTPDDDGRLLQQLRVEHGEPTGADADSETVRDTARNLVESIMLDMWPRRGAIVDFGLKSQECYEALYYPIREGEITPEQLDAALGKGDALTALARSARSNPHREVIFRTDWDDMPSEPRQFPDDGPLNRELSEAEMQEFADAVIEGSFNISRKPGQETRPGPEETPLERVERQIGHIKIIPDPYDFSIEELGPWDTGVSEEWIRLAEIDKLSSLVQQVDWRDISPENKRRLLEREVDFERVPVKAQQEILGEVWHESAAHQHPSPGRIAEGRDGSESSETGDVIVRAKAAGQIDPEQAAEHNGDRHHDREY